MQEPAKEGKIYKRRRLPAVNYSDTSNRASCFSHSGYYHIPAQAGQFSRYVHKRLGSGSPCPTMQGFTRISGSAGLPAGYWLRHYGRGPYNFHTLKKTSFTGSNNNMSFISHNSKKLFLQKKKAGKPASSSKWENQSSENLFPSRWIIFEKL